MAITASERTEIMELVILMFNAAPGATYLSIVVNMYEANGHNMQNLAHQLAGSNAYVGLNPNFQTAAEFASAFLTPLGLQADAYAIDFITARFNAGTSKGEIAYQAYLAINTVTAGYPAQYVNAKAILDNKVEVALYYSVTKAIAETNLAELQLVLSGVTADPATVTSTKAAIDDGSLGVSGISVTLTTAQNIIVGTSGNDNVYGLFGGADATYTTGDDVNLGAGGFDRINLTATGVTASPANTVKNVEFINIEDTVGATFNALLVENTPAITFTNTQAGLTSLVTNGGLSSVMGISGKGNLTVDFATTSGTTDTAKVSLSSVGASGALSAINVGDTNTVEAVTIAATGSNFIDLTAGTAAAKVTITGSGTNDITFSSISTTSTIDASTSTGTNTFRVGTGFGNGDVVKGGTGADTLRFNAIVALGAVTLTGVETLTGDFDADVSLNLATSSGVKTLNSAGSSGSLSVSNAMADLTKVNITSTATADTDNDFSLSYATGVVGAPVVTIGGAANITMDDLTFTRVGSVTLNSADVNDNTLDDVVIALSSDVVLSSTIGADGYLYMDQVSGTDFGNITVSVGESGYFNINDLYASGGAIGDISMTVGVNASGYIGYAEADGGGIGAITMTVGSGGSGYIYADASGYFSAGDAGDVGALSLTLASGASGYIYASANSGNVGDLSLTVGANTYGYVSGYASGYSGIVGSDYEGGGNLGNITLNVTGASGYGEVSATSYISYATGSTGGDIGNVTVNVAGNGSDGYVTLSGGSGGDVAGTISVTTTGSSYTYVSASASWSPEEAGGNIGNTTAVVGEGGYFELDLDASGTVGTVSVTAGNNTDVYVDVSGSAGYGTFDVTVGDDSYFYLETETDVAGAAVTVTAGANSSGYVYVDVSSGVPSGPVTVTGSSTGEQAYVYFEGSGPIDVVNLSGWLGTYYIYAAGSTVGTVISVGADGGTAEATSGADVLTGGAGNDTLYGNAGSDVITGVAGNDILYGGAGGDDLDGGAGNDVIYGGTEADLIQGGGGVDSVFGEAGNDTINGGAGNDFHYGGAGNDTINLGAGGTDKVIFELAAGNGVDTINGFAIADDAVNVELLGAGNIGFEAVLTGAGAQSAFADATAYVVSTNGTAASVTTSGTATLTAADFTATSLTNLATFMSERFTTTAAVTDGVLVVNYTASGANTTYVYSYTADATANTTIDAVELTLVGVISNGGSALGATNVDFTA